MRKPAFCICRNHAADQCLCFSYIDSTIPLLPIYDVSILWMYSLVCVVPGRKSQEVFSLRSSYRNWSPDWQLHQDMEEE